MVGHYQERNGEIVYLPYDQIKGEKANKDGSIRFKFIGGPYHDMIFRVYAPYDTVRWPDGTTYDLVPPFNLKKSDKWRYVYNAEESVQAAKVGL